MPPQKQGRELKGTSALALWIGWLLGPGAWALHEGGTYSIIPTVCRTGITWPVHALTFVSLAIALVGAAISFFLLRKERPKENTASDSRVDRSRFLGLVGIGLCLAAIFGILLEASASWYLDYCTGV